MIGIFISYSIYCFIDYVWNGMFVDWFTHNYIGETEGIYDGKYMVIREPVWPVIKSLIFRIFCINVVLWIVSIFIISHFYVKNKVEKTVMEIHDGICGYMQCEKDITESFQKIYPEIAVQIIQMKTDVQNREQLLQGETKRKNDLIIYLAHDLKTPLTSVIGYLNLLSEMPDMSKEQRTRCLNITLEKANRLDQLMNEFFEITRYNLQQIELEKESIDLCYMLFQMVDEFYPLLDAHNNTTELNINEDIRVYGDPIKLARVFNNVLKNAIYYSYRNTAIRIWTESTDTMILIYFSNKGKTIPTSKLNAIFEKFFRLDESRAADTGGAGLGLAIAKEIVALHAGKITAESENEQTTFCISIPKDIG